MIRDLGVGDGGASLSFPELKFASAMGGGTHYMKYDTSFFSFNDFHGFTEGIMGLQLKISRLKEKKRECDRGSCQDKALPYLTDVKRS
jgi:hypothetical protein